MSAATVSNLNNKAFKSDKEWRNRPLTCICPYVFIDGIYLKKSWGSSYENVVVMVAVGVNDDGYREITDVAEGFAESSGCWRELLSWLKGQGLSAVRIFIGDKAAAKRVREGASETLTYTRFPMAHWRSIRINNAIERLNYEIRRRTCTAPFPTAKAPSYWKLPA